MRKSAKLGLYAVVLTGMVGGTAAWATTDKSVGVSIDGQARTIHTRAGTVGAALKSAHITLGAHDTLAPAASSSVHDGSHIVVLRGRLLHLDVDGRHVSVWTTAATVSQALGELGYGSGQTVSVSRSTRLPLTPTEITLLTPKAVTIRADGLVREVITTDRTVGNALAAAGLRVGAHDELSTPLASALHDGEVIVLKRVRLAVSTTTKTIPYATKTTKNPDSPIGTTVIIVEGHKGLQKIHYQLVYVDGKLAGKRLVGTTVVRKPVDQVEKTGSEKAKKTTSSGTSSGKSSGGTSGGSGKSSGGGGSGPVPSGSAQSIAKALLAKRGWGGDQFSCLVSLWNRESGWNTHAANPSGAYGIPQALPGSKMSSAGPDWQDNATTQITWGLGYISARYSTPCGAWAHSQATGWY